MPARPLPLEQLIGAPLRSIVLGQGIASQATADFISEVGLERTSERDPVARTFEFTFLHATPDPENPGGVIDTPTRVTVPVLTVIPIPNIDITEATIELQADIVSAKPLPARQAGLRLDRTKASILPQPTQLTAVYARPKTANGNGGGTLSISLKIARAPLGQGLETVVSLLTEGITARPAEKPR
jgi:hypothetical protein